MEPVSGIKAGRGGDGWIPGPRAAIRIALIYALVGCLWNFLSSLCIDGFSRNDRTLDLLERLNGWFFVVFTAALLGWALNRYFAVVRRMIVRLRESDDRFSKLFQVSPCGSALCRVSDHRFVDVNHSFLEIVGLSREEVLGRTAEELNLFVDGTIPCQWQSQLQNGSVVRNASVRINRKPDEIRHLIASADVVDIHGETMVLLVGMDVTERIDAERTVREKKRLLQTFVEDNPAAIAMLDREMRYLAVSDRWLSDYRIPGEGLLGRSHYEIFPNTPERWQKIHRHCLAGAVEKRDADPYIREDGSLDWFQWEIRPWRTESGAVGGLIMFSEIITERKSAVEALQLSEENLRAMFEVASIGVAQADPKTGRWLRVNRKMCEITGYRVDELLRLRGNQLTHPEDRERSAELFRRVVDGDLKDGRIEKRFIRKDGSCIWVNVNLTVVRDDVGNPLRTMAIIEDISQRKDSEEDRIRLATAMEQAAESIVITDLAGCICYVNPAFERVTGYSREEAVGQNPRFLSSGQQDGAFYRQMWETLRRGEVWHGHFLNKRKDGTLYEENATISPVRNTAGKVVSYMAIKLDVTRESALEAQFRHAQKMEAVGLLAGGVAHDFNNILAAMMLQIDLALLVPGSSSEVLDAFRQIQGNVRRASNLTRQLLLFSRRPAIQPKNVELNALVRDFTKMLDRIIGEHINLSLQLSDEPLMIHGDAGMLEQTLMNLAVNARDAMPGGGSLLVSTCRVVLDELFAEANPGISPGIHICLRVKDTGTGIPTEVLPRIFEPFFTTKEVGKGTGLGLATVFGIVKQHHGCIRVESQLGAGTEFLIYLPQTSGDAAAKVLAGARSRGSLEKILLVEDESELRGLTRRLLEEYGYLVLEAANGREALAVWNTHRKEIVLLFTDIIMPGGLNGQRLARMLKAEKPVLKVMYCSGYSRDLEVQGFELGADEILLHKPCTPDGILQAIRKCLDGHVVA